MGAVRAGIVYFALTFVMGAVLLAACLCAAAAPERLKKYSTFREGPHQRAQLAPVCNAMMMPPARIRHNVPFGIRASGCGSSSRHISLDSAQQDDDDPRTQFGDDAR